jgi:ubiquinone/menaquinone biosynthesis C-methylase UbiE
MTQGYADISRSFDRFAVRYDDVVEPNPIHARLRRRSLMWLDQAFGPGMHVLEVGCGTGTEAVHLARRGVEVTAIDISESMVRHAEHRVREAGLEHGVHVLQAASADIAARFGKASFDGAYASFGALNCGPELPAVARDLARVMKPGAVFATSVISRPCTWEIMAGVLGLNPRKAFRRLREPATINLAPRDPLELHVYSERELRRAFTPHFRIERLEGWLLTIPPPYLADLWNRVEVLHAPAYRAEDLLTPRWPFRGWGEHIHMWARRCA